MGLIGFFKPGWRKVLIFLLPLIVSLIVFLAIPAKRPDVWEIPDLLSFTFLHFPTYVEVLITTESQIINGLVFYIPWYLFSCLMVWVNDTVELKGLLWRKLQKGKEGKEVEEGKHEEKEEEGKKEEEHEKKEEERKVEELDEDKLKERKRHLEEEEKRIKEEKERLREELGRLNIEKLREIGLDIEKNKIRCVNCKKWETLSKDKILDLMKKEGLKIIWSYECKECKG